MSRSASLDLKVNISELKKNLQTAKKELKTVEAEYKNLSSAAELCTDKHEKLDMQFEANKKLLDAQKKVVKQYSEIVEKTQQKVDNLKQEQSELAQKLIDAKNATEKDSKAISELEKELDECTKSLSKSEYELQKNQKGMHEFSAKANKTEKAVSDLRTEYRVLRRESDYLREELDDLSDEVENNAIATMSAQDAMGVLSDAVGSVKGVVDDLTQSFGNLVINGINKAVDGIKKFAEYSFGVGIPFEASVSKYAATMGKNVNDPEVNRAEEKAKELGATTLYTSTETMGGMNILAQSGLNIDEQIAAIESVLDLAIAGGLSMENSASYITASVKGFGDEMANAVKYADLIAKGAALSNTSTEMLGVALSDISASANAYKQSVDGVMLSLLRLSEQNVVGSDAATALGRAYMDIYTPTKKAKEALDALGISAYTSKGKAKDFNVVCDEITKALSKMSEEEANTYKNLIFTTYGLNAFNKMTASSTEKVEEFKEGLADVKGASKEMADTMADNLSGALDEVVSAAEAFGIEAYEKVKPSVRGVVDSIAEYIQEQMTKLKDGGGLSPAFDAIAGAIDDFGAKMPGMLDKHTPLLENIFNLTGDVIAQIINSLPIIIDTLLPKLADLLEKILEVLPSIIEDVLPKIIDFIEYVITNLPNIITTLGGLKIGGDFLNFGVKIAEIGIAVKVLCTTLGTTLKDALIAAGTSISAVATPVLIVIGVIASLVAILVSAWNHSEVFRAHVESFINVIKNSLIRIIEMVSDKFKLFAERLGITSETGEIFLDIIDAIAMILVDTLGVAIEFVIDIFGGLLEMVLDIIAVLIDLGKIIGDVLTGNWDGVKENFKNLGDDLYSAVTAPFEGIGNFIKDSLDGLNIRDELFGEEEEEEQENKPNERYNFNQPQLPDVSEERGIVASNNTYNAREKVGNNELDGFDIDLSEYILEPPSEEQKRTFIEAYNTLITVIKTIWSETVSDIKNNIDNFIDGFNNACEVVKIMWDGLKTYVSDLINENKRELEQTCDFLLSLIGESWKIVTHDIRTNINKILDICKNTVNTIIDLLKKVWDSIINIFNTLGNVDLYEIGKKIIQSLINGLSSLIDKLKQKINSIKNLLSFNSDIEVPTIGNTTPLGNNVGVNLDDVGKVGNTTPDLTPKLNMLNNTISTYSSPNNYSRNTTNNHEDNRNYTINNTFNSPEPMNERKMYKQQNKVLQSALSS